MVKQQFFSPFSATEELVNVGDFTSRNARGGYRLISSPMAGCLLRRSTSWREIFEAKMHTVIE